MQNKRVILVEDNKDISDLVTLHLNDVGIKVDVCSDGVTGWNCIKQNSYDLIILDIMLPGMDGLEICKRIRTKIKQYIPTMMLTSRATEMDRVLGLELGADDYLTKPFSLMEMVARVKALIRHHDAIQNSTEETEHLHFNGLSINTQNREVLKAHKPLELTAKEFDLLVYMARHPGQVFSRLQLLDKVWGYGHEGYEHTVNSHINRLRSKLESDPRTPQYIKTVWGVGYHFIGIAEVSS